MNHKGSIGSGSADSIKHLASHTIAFARAYSYDSEAALRLQEDLEKELERENSAPGPSHLSRWRHRGERLLTSKHVLLMVVFLNLVDCALVMGELILDIHYIKANLEESEESSDNFMSKMSSKYPRDVAHIDSITDLYNKLDMAKCTWADTAKSHVDNTDHNSEYTSQNESTQRRSLDVQNTPKSNITIGNHQDSRDLTMNTSTENESHYHADEIMSVSQDSYDTPGNGRNRRHRRLTHWEDIAHGLHRASITILALLVVETFMKISVMGSRFFRKRLELFDGIIVFGSIILDLVFIKGLTVYRIQDGILLLSFLLPWRVIRVVNSLVVAVLDHQHFRLKLLYKEKKDIVTQMKHLKKREGKFDSHLQNIEKFCISEGIPKWKIRQLTALGRKKSTITSMAALALGGMISDLTLHSTDFDEYFSRQGLHQKRASLNMISEQRSHSDNSDVFNDDINEVRNGKEAKRHSSAPQTEYEHSGKMVPTIRDERLPGKCNGFAGINGVATL